MIIRSAAKSGIATVVTFWVATITTMLINQTYEKPTLFAFIFGTLILWLVGFVIALLLILLLYPIKKHTPPAVSLLTFSLVGFLLPAIVMAWIYSTPVHDNPSLFEQNMPASIQGIVVMGVIGASAAITAWISLNKKKGRTSASTLSPATQGSK